MKSITCFSAIMSLYTQQSRRADKANEIISLIDSISLKSQNSEQITPATKQLITKIQEIQQRHLINNLLQEYDLHYNFLTNTLTKTYNGTETNYQQTSKQSLPKNFVPSRLITELRELINTVDQPPISNTLPQERLEDEPSTSQSLPDSKFDNDTTSDISLPESIVSQASTIALSQVGSLASKASEVSSDVSSKFTTLKVIFVKQVEDCTDTVTTRARQLGNSAWQAPGQLRDTATSAATTAKIKVTDTAKGLGTATTQPFIDLGTYINKKSQAATREYTIWCSSLQRWREACAVKSELERERAQNRINQLSYIAAQTFSAVEWQENLQRVSDLQSRLDRTRNPRNFFKNYHCG